MPKEYKKTYKIQKSFIVELLFLQIYIISIFENDVLLHNYTNNNYSSLINI